MFQPSLALNSTPTFPFPHTASFLTRSFINLFVVQFRSITTGMPIFGQKVETSITVKVTQICYPGFNEDMEDDAVELQLGDLLPLIKIQPSTGATEAARAIRKQIKYGQTPEIQTRAIRLLEVLVLNGGTTIGTTVVRDDKLSELLRGVITGKGQTGNGGTYDRKVQRAARALAVGWQQELSDIDAFRGMPKLWTHVPKRKLRQSKYKIDVDDDDFENVFELKNNELPVDDTSLDDEQQQMPPPRPARATAAVPAPKKKKKRRLLGRLKYADDEYRIPQINYKVEAPKIRTTLADTHTQVTILVNILKQLPSGVLPVEDKEATLQFDKCKKTRRKVLRYIQFVGAGDASLKSFENQKMDDEFLGALISANEQLVDVFKRYDQLSGLLVSYDNMEVLDSGESYYTESEDDEADENVTAMNRMSLRAPPPPPPKPVRRQDTADTVASDPFGDPFVG